jgi:hypothetical protein
VKNNSINSSSIQVNEVNDKEENNSGFGSGDFISFSSEPTTSKVLSNSNPAAKKREGVKNNGEKGNSSHNPRKIKIKLR